MTQVCREEAERRRQKNDRDELGDRLARRHEEEEGLLAAEGDLVVVDLEIGSEIPRLPWAQVSGVARPEAARHKLVLACGLRLCLRLAFIVFLHQSEAQAVEDGAEEEGDGGDDPARFHPVVFVGPDCQCEENDEPREDKVDQTLHQDQSRVDALGSYLVVDEADSAAAGRAELAPGEGPLVVLN